MHNAIKMHAISTLSALLGRPAYNNSAVNNCVHLSVVKRSRPKLAHQLLLLLILLLGAGSYAQAGVFCSEYPGGVIDGDIIAPADMPTAITIDTDCTFQNFPLSNPLKATINFQTNDPLIYLIIFDNVALDGNMACSNVNHNIWFVNAPPASDVSNSCQDLLIPAESIRKQAPASTASIGVPFTYTLTLPSMQFPIGDPSPNDLAKVILWDDISAAATGADLTYVGINAYYKDSLAPVTLVQQTDPLAQGGVWTPKNLSYEPIPLIVSGEQIMVDITVVLDDTPLNAAGTSFINTAKWWFGRLIDGVAYDPLPGEAGISELMTISEPELIVTKTSDTTALNIGIPANFTIDVQNIGGSDAWNTTILDLLPDGATAGMCDTDPTATVTAQLFAADGTTIVTNLLTQGFHYSVNYSPAPDCQMSFTVLHPLAKIGPSQHLIIKYQSQLDADTTGDGIALTNIAGATQWFGADGSYTTRSYNKGLTDGTPLLVDHEDSNIITTALSGYYFQKTVTNVTTGASPAVTAAPGDTLRYRLRLFNVDQNFTGITINDLLDPTLFDTSTFAMKVYATDSVANFNTTTGQLTISGVDPVTFPLDLVPGSELVLEFEIDLSSSLINGVVVPNQATLIADGPVSFNSDDPFLNGIAAPGVQGDPTNILIQAPGPLEKVNTQASAGVGEQFTYTITVPAIPINAPFYDVRIIDDLTVSNADMQFVSASVVSGGTWTLSNTGTATVPVIEDTITGIDIPANAQAVIEITVELLNTSTNISGQLFDNRADYTYNRTNGVNITQTAGEVGLSGAMNVIEPELANITKTASNSTPTAGETVRYSVTLSASAGANFSDVFDVTLTDNLGLGLAYAGNPTVSIGAGVSADNTILEPVITGDGIGTAQTLVWSFDSGNADIDIVAGTAVTISYDVLLLDSVLANQTLTNSAIAQWTSIDGVAASERDGSDGLGFLNDYATDPVIETVTTPDIIATITKDRSSDTFGAADSNVRIGDLVEYSLTISIPEGTLGSLQIVDTLPQGLAFEGVVSINGNTGPAPYVATAPFSHADITAASLVQAGDPALAASTLTWTLGNVSNLPNDTLSDNFVIVYRARVLDNVFAQTASAQSLNNTVSISYDTAIATVSNSDLVTAISLTQPVLTVSKSAVTAGGDTVIDPAELVTYSVDIINSGSAPAYDTVLQDIIPLGMRTAAVTVVSAQLLGAGTVLANPVPSYDAVTGLVVWNLDSGVADSYTIPAGDTLRIVYQAQADAALTGGLTLTNSAQVTNYYSFDDEAVPTLATITGIRESYAASNIATTTLYTGALPSKVLISSATASIGEELVYQITVPGTLSTSALYDLQITDTLDTNLEFISATVTGGIGVTDNSTTAPSEMKIAITEIPAGQQAVIELRARLKNIVTAQQGVAINNTASYTYAYTSGGTAQSALSSTEIVSVNVIEPGLTVSKAVTPISAAPITGGDILEYVLTISNTGSATAYDVNLVDTLAPELQLDSSFTPTALIDAVAVAGFNATPSGAPNGPLIWGQGNADGSLDIPAGSTLLLTYRVLINATTQSNITLSNSVLADWSTLDGTSIYERTGTGCPVVSGANDYCSAPAIASVTTVDTNTFSKQVIADNYAAANDATVRIGDMLTYQLSLNLQEGTTRNVAVQDVLPAGLAFVDIVSINGDAVADYTAPASGAGSNFSYATVTAASLPVAGQTGSLNFTLGNVANDPLGDASSDSLLIIYRARVTENTLAQQASSTLNNTATLTYIDGTGAAVIDPLRLQSIATATVLQPLMSTPSKTDSVFSSPANVNIASDVMHFTLQSCNSGLSPAYNVQLTDALATQLDETSLVGPVVTINGAAATAGVNYSYTAPAVRGGSMLINLITPVNPGQCVSINYDIGFYTDFGPNQSWNNSVTVDEYWSLPSQSGEQYASLGPTIFTMANTAIIAPPAKTMLSPLSAEATIGEEVVYRLTVPSVAVNAALYDVVITDTLHASLEMISASDVSGNAFSFTDNTVANNVSLTIAQIPAGQQAVIELRGRVANNAAANAGTSFSNLVSYSYATTSGGASIIGGSASTATPLTIIEPALVINKTVLNSTSPGNPPTAGDVLRYSLSFTASGAGAGDNFSDAFDLSIADSLSLGLLYQTASATANGAGNTIADPLTVGDGVSVAQNLNWNLAAANADIDVVEGSTVTVSYDVVVLDNVLANQTLTNTASAQWTGLDGGNALERSGTGAPFINDYFTAPVSTTLTTPDTTTLTKLRLSDTYGAADANLRIGDLVEYEIRIVLQEGQHNNLQLTDSLPQGLAFAGVVHINGDTSSAYNAVTPFVHSDITPVVSGNPASGPSTVTFTLGNVINVGDNNAANDEFVIVYNARVLDNEFGQSNNTILTNNAQLDYTTAIGAAQQIAAASSTLLQPNLALTKLAVAAGGDSVIDAGELVSYTIDVVNSGSAPAYDVVIEDVIPFGMRNGAATITMLSTTLVNSATVLANPIPVYDAATGIARWNLDIGVANAYTIAAGETLRLVYQLQADADLGAGLTLSNQAVVTNYYSFDDEAVPTLGGINGVRETYGPTNTAIVTLSSPLPGALLKQNPADLTVSVGETFSYRITVPAIPIQTALHDVRIVDDLNASAADLTYLSVSKISGSQPWTPVNTGTVKNLIIEDASVGIDIPAGEQVIVEVTVEVDNTATNVSGLLFNNTASYSYNQLANNPASQLNGAASTTADMTIVGPDNLTLEKTGPAEMRIGTPQTFSLNIHNSGTATAWDLSIVDVLPNPAIGGMCDVAPFNITAQIFLADGVTAVSAPLVQGSDFVVNYLPQPDCTLTLTMLTAAAAVGADNRLIVTYDAQLDNDNVHGVTLTNIAAVTEWFSGDTAGAGASGAVRTYNRNLTDGTVATLDHEDAHSIVTELPIVSVLKSVVNISSGQNPGSNASPGDTLRYSILIQNVSPVELTNFSFVDELDALNAIPVFAADTLNLITIPAGADTTNTNASGGLNSTGLLDIRNLNLGPVGSATETVLLEFEATLAAVITSGTVVLNQGQLTATNLILSTDDPVINGIDDPNLLGDEDPTQTLIASAPLFEVLKTSEDITADPAELMPGDTLRYTITVKNIGSENAVNSILRDQVPANTTYVAGSTTLNGIVFADITAGSLPLQNGILINAPEDTTPGAMRADATASTTNVATITFDVVISNNVVEGAVISNQAFFNADGAGSGLMPETLSDDPATATIDDPTQNVIGNQPLLDAIKTVSIVVDNGSPGSLDPGDVLRYSITINNIGANEATGVIFTDAVPANTTYVADSVTLNGLPVAQPDAGVSPLIAGIDVNSSDLTPALPTAGNGIISAGASAVITFDVKVDAAVAVGTVISNQGSVVSNELPIELTDADGIDSNGDQPTLIVVGNAQLVSIIKTVSIVGGGPALAGGQLEYRISVTNISTVAATNIIITDNLDLPVAGQLTYIAGSGLLNGLATGVSYAAPVVTADYATPYGNLLPGESAELVFRASINNALAIGTTITNSAEVYWNAATQNASATVSLDVGGTPGVANVNGKAWHDANFNNSFDSGEVELSNWNVDVYRNNTLLGSVSTDASGHYSVNGLAPNSIGPDRYDIRFRAPGATASTAKLGLANSDPVLGFTDALHRIYNIVLNSGSNVQNLNLPIDPNGVVYDSVIRTPVNGASVALLNAATGVALSSACFDDVNQQNQITTANGYYKFDLNFSQGDCNPGSDYLIEFSPPATGYNMTASVVVTPQTDATTAALDVVNCPLSAEDAIPVTANICEATASEFAPAISAAPMSAATNYYLHLTLNNTAVPEDSQLFNNHLPVDPVLSSAVDVTKTTSMVNVTRSQLVPYTITVKNGLPVTLVNSTVIDTFPAGFKYVKGSARLNDVELEPVQNGLQLSWSNIDLIPNDTQTFKLLLIAGAAVTEGEYINRVHVVDSLTNSDASGVATATVRVIPDPAFDCSDVIGKVFEDKNLNGYQDEGEDGLTDIRLITARGLNVTSDNHGRFHLTCAVSPDETRGNNFIIKLDERSLPSGYRVTTENPRVVRATRGKMMKFNFGATIHHVITIDLADGVFVNHKDEVHDLWKPRLDLLMRHLKKSPSILRLSYLADTESEALVDDRLDKLKDEIQQRWRKLNKYRLIIETDVFWRRGGPPG